MPKPTVSPAMKPELDDLGCCGLSGVITTTYHSPRMRSLALTVVLALAVPSVALAQEQKPWPVVVRQVVTPISPFFPEAQRAKGVRKAVVKLELTVNPKGIVQTVKVLESAGADFDDAAVTAAKLTVFAEAKTMTMQPFTVTFELR
jgi:TonB family protein